METKKKYKVRIEERKSRTALITVETCSASDAYDLVSENLNDHEWRLKNIDTWDESPGRHVVTFVWEEEK